MMNLLLHIKHIDNICRHVIEDIDKSDKNSFGITYCDICVQIDIKHNYYLYVRFHKWGSKTFVDQNGHYTGTFDSYYIKIDMSHINQEYIAKRIYQYFDNKEYDRRI